MRYAISLSLVLFGCWLLWSGHYSGLLIGLGLVSSLAILAIALRMRVVDPEGAPLEVTLRVFGYLPWLLWEIVKANVDVARRILSSRRPISPVMIRVKAGQRSELGRTIYANSITLTPGTVSVEVEGDEITVHALTREAARGLETGEMDRRVTAVEGRR